MAQTSRSNPAIGGAVPTQYDLMMALARKIVSGEEEDADAETMEEVFAQARDAEAVSEEPLVDEGWKLVESLPRTGCGVEPATVESNGNGPNGHHDATGIGPTVELAPVNGQMPANGHGNSHHEDDPEPQRTLFSWAEFMAEEPLKPKGRRRKPQLAAASLFEWALTLEQEREAEPVGAGR